ncbi:hypothetical protein [Spiroplasma endosymbiont of Acasis viretata]|uniref:hypothetical protein n=1 Tax=Spiroplasma endosymbiont of Acasis viretata TaxID=3066306 RepID=UPI00313B1803
MKDKKKDLQEEIEIFENEIIKLDEKIKNIVLEIEPLHKELELNLNKKSVIKKYAFLNVISFGLFNFLKKKKLNHKIQDNNTKIKYLMGEISHFDDKKSQIKTKIIEKYEKIANIIFDKNMKENSIKNDNNQKQRSNSI